MDVDVVRVWSFGDWERENLFGSFRARLSLIMLVILVVVNRSSGLGLIGSA